MLFFLALLAWAVLLIQDTTASPNSFPSNDNGKDENGEGGVNHPRDDNLEEFLISFPLSRKSKNDLQPQESSTNQEDESVLTLRLLQKPSFAFDEEVQDSLDDTGMVVWGASVCLGRYLAQEVLPSLFLQRQQDTVKPITILELGCGGSAIPSLTSCRYSDRFFNNTTANGKNDASAAVDSSSLRIIATDQTEKTLQHLGRVAALNQCSRLERYTLQWGDDQETDDGPLHNVQADLIVASDMIYSHATVPLLVQTIQRYLAPHGTAYIAVREGRPGVYAFHAEKMPQAGFTLSEKVSCQPYQQAQEEEAAKPPSPTWLPPGFLNAGGENRWRGHHHIYVFQRTINKSRETAEL